LLSLTSITLRQVVPEVDAWKALRIEVNSRLALLTEETGAAPPAAASGTSETLHTSKQPARVLKSPRLAGNKRDGNDSAKQFVEPLALGACLGLLTFYLDDAILRSRI
jgi:hypothetical protein